MFKSVPKELLRSSFLSAAGVLISTMALRELVREGFEGLSWLGVLGTLGTLWLGVFILMCGISLLVLAISSVLREERQLARERAEEWMAEFEQLADKVRSAVGKENSRTKDAREE